MNAQLKEVATKEMEQELARQERARQLTLLSRKASSIETGDTADCYTRELHQMTLAITGYEAALKEFSVDDILAHLRDLVDRVRFLFWLGKVGGGNLYGLWKDAAQIARIS
jgi:hypothetical protein